MLTWLLGTLDAAVAVLKAAAGLTGVCVWGRLLLHCMLFCRYEHVVLCADVAAGVAAGEA
jgi:hypothetical protein